MNELGMSGMPIPLDIVDDPIPIDRSGLGVSFVGLIDSVLQRFERKDHE